MLRSVSNNLRIHGHGGSSSLSVPVANQNSCLNNDENYYVSCDRGDFRSAKIQKATDFEADFLQREMQRLKTSDYVSSEQAILGSDPNDRKILERGDGAEEPAFISLKFKEFDSIIENMEVDRKNISYILAYKLARNQNKAFVDDPEFKIGFLRAERYNTTRAARRMLRYLKIKLDLFGIQKLTRDIRLEDIGEDGKRYLLIGDLQILPERDEAGRLIIFLCDTLTKEELDRQRESIEKAIFYIVDCLYDDSEKGKIKGFVTVLWRIHNEEPADLEFHRVVDQIGQCCRAKPSAYHMCRPKPGRVNLQHLNAYSKMVLPAVKNARILRYFRSHHGTAQECKYTLKTKYGIDSLPIQEGINNDTNSNRPIHNRYTKEWVSKRMEIESARKFAVQLNLCDDDIYDDDVTDDSFKNTLKNLESLGSVVSSDQSLSKDPAVPNIIMIGQTAHTEESHLPPVDEGPNKGCDVRPNDVLLGQASSLRDHPGNDRLRQMVTDSFDKYYASTTRKMEKIKMAQEIAHQIEHDGGRFLKQTTSDEGGLWVEASDDEAHKKVANTFRNIVKKKKRGSAEEFA